MFLRNLIARILNGAEERKESEGIEHPTPEQVRADAEELARSVLGVSAEEAYRRLDRGELDGLGIEVDLKLYRHLLGGHWSTATD